MMVSASVLIVLTPAGKAMFRKIQKRESRLIAAVAAAMDGRDLETAVTALATLRATLQPLIKVDP